MADRYVNLHTGDVQTHFEKAVVDKPERSVMTAEPTRITTFNAGRLVPIYCAEMLPSETINIDLDFIIRETTMKTPVMGGLLADIFAYFVPNRIVNEEWKEIMGENENGAWYPQETQLNELFPFSNPMSFPVGSIADHYGLPTQGSIPASTLKLLNDLRFRGYYRIWNEEFRDQNYQAPDPFGLWTQNNYYSGVGDKITAEPLKVNKLHDRYTSVLPSPQKGAEVSIGLAGSAPVSGLLDSAGLWKFDAPAGISLQAKSGSAGARELMFGSQSSTVTATQSFNVAGSDILQIRTVQSANEGAGNVTIEGVSGLSADLSEASGISISDLRMASASQRFYEQLARTGSRYREYIAGFFGIEVDNPMRDVPTLLGHIRRELEVYQTAQTSASPTSGTGTPQGNLAAFSYTRSGGGLIKNGAFTAVEHGYIHIFAVVRQKNVYVQNIPHDMFRHAMLDFYQPQLANISEQPIYSCEVNAFASNGDRTVFGYQEAWAEYRDELDTVAGYMRPGISESLASWNYADEYDSGLLTADDEWLLSNAQEVVDRTVAVSSEVADQFYGYFVFKVRKELPMPVYSVPELL